MSSSPRLKVSSFCPLTSSPQDAYPKCIDGLFTGSPIGAGGTPRKEVERTSRPYEVDVKH